MAALQVYSDWNLQKVTFASNDGTSMGFSARESYRGMWQEVKISDGRQEMSKYA